jgi:SAM-dependent methyltransferase
MDYYLDGHGPPAYERFLVPALFAECADRLVAAAAPAAGDRVLDVACGTGVVARRAAAGADLGRLVGVDVNEAMLDVARSVGSTADAQWRVADAAALPFADGSFDVVYCQQGLQYLDDPLAGLREMARVLAVGGRLALAVWRPVEHSPGFAVLIEALERHVGPEAAAVMRWPFAGPTAARPRPLVERAGLEGAVGRVAIVTARFPSAKEFLRRQVLASPRDELARLTERAEPGREPRWGAVAERLDDMLAPHTDDEGVVFPMQTWLVTAKLVTAKLVTAKRVPS